MTETWHSILLYGMGKVLRYVITLWVIISMNFLIPRIMPGDPMINLLGEDAVHIDKQILDDLKAEYGLDRSLGEQYAAYITGLARLDFGYSIQKHIKVAQLLWNRLIQTIILVLPSIVIGGTAALVFGIICGFKHGSRLDRLITTIATCTYTLPAFLLAMVMVSIFSFHLGIFPLGGLASGNRQGLFWWIDIVWHLSLPVLVLSILESAYGLIIMRSAVIRVMDEYFILVAQAKGLSRRVIGLKHVLRNVLPEYISIMALNLGFMVSGALVIEIVFSLNGMGTLIYDAVVSRDYPVLEGAFVVLTFFMLAANLTADLMYCVVDPRISDGRKKR